MVNFFFFFFPMDMYGKFLMNEDEVVYLLKKCMELEKYEGKWGLLTCVCW